MPSLAKLKKDALEKYNWSPENATPAAVKEWTKLWKTSQHVSDKGDHHSAKVVTEKTFVRLVAKYGCVSPSVGDALPDLVIKYFNPIRETPKLVNETIVSAPKPEPLAMPLKEGEAVVAKKPKQASKRQRDPHKAIVALVEFMAKFAMMDYWWQKYCYDESGDVPKRIYWLAEYQILNGVPNTRYSDKAKSGKTEKTRYGILHQKLSVNGLVGHGYDLRDSRRRDKHFGPKTAQGYPEKKVKSIVIIPITHQLTYQPGKEWALIRSVATEK